MLESRQVRLVPLDPADISDDYVGWFNDPETFRFLGTKFGQTRTSVRQYVESIRAPNLMCKIVWKDGDRHVGNLALHGFQPVNRRMELGIVIGSGEARGKGLGREACSLLIQHAFEHLNLHRVTATAVVDNVPMKKVFLDLGFVIEGTLREHFYLEGRYRDMYWFGLLRPEFKPCH